MKHLMILTVGICLLLTSVPAMADQAEDEEAIKKVMEQLYAAANKHDVKGYMALCDEKFENWIGTIKGRDAFGKMISESWERQTDTQFKPLDEIGIVFVAADVAIYKLRDEVTGRLDVDGKPMGPVKRLMARVFVKKNGNWIQAAYFQRPTEE